MLSSRKSAKAVRVNVKIANLIFVNFTASSSLINAGRLNKKDVTTKKGNTEIKTY